MVKVNQHLTVLKTSKDDHIADAQKVLKDAGKQEFEFVIVLGCKDDKVHIRHSAALDCVTKIGMIETAKLDFWKKWKEEVEGVEITI